MAKGAFISFEGIDGSGKSTQARLLKNNLMNAGHTVTLTREPGGSVGAEEIRKLLVEGAPGRWSPETEILLFTAARRDHLERTIQPGRKRGDVVITDRFADSTRVYQGVARAGLRSMVDQLHHAVIDTEPDLTLIIDMDPKTALSRGLARNSGEDRFEEFGQDFQHKLREGFLAVAADDPKRCKIIDGNRAESAVASAVLAHVNACLNG